MKEPKISETGYEKILKELYHHKIRYLIVGGVALNLYNINRFTADLDLMLGFDNQNVLEFVKVMNAFRYRPRAPVKPEEFANPKKREILRKQKDATVFTFAADSPSFPSIDIFLFHPIDFDRAYRRRRTVRGGSYDISVISPRDLLKLKMIAGRDQDKMDIKRMKEEMDL